MSQVVPTLQYTSSHEWVLQKSADRWVVGITDHAQSLLGDLVYIELPEVGQHIKAKEEVAVVESVKAAADVYAPVSGEILSVNTAVQSDPALVNKAPYEAGWLFEIRPSHPEEEQQLLTASVYQSQVEA